MFLQKIHKNQKGVTTTSLVIIIVVLFLVLTIGTIGIMIMGNTKKQYTSSKLQYKYSLFGNNYTKENIKAFLESGRDCKNYSFSYYESDLLYAGKVYDNKLHITSGSKDIYYDYDTKDMVIISSDEKAFMTGKTELEEEYKNLLGQEFLTLLEYDKAKLKFIRNERIDDFDCIVERVEISDVNDIVENITKIDSSKFNWLEKNSLNNIKVYLDFWIDSESGLVPKYECTVKYKGEKTKVEINTNLKVGEVKETDIVMPKADIYRNNGYTVINL